MADMETGGDVSHVDGAHQPFFLLTGAYQPARPFLRKPLRDVWLLRVLKLCSCGEICIVACLFTLILFGFMLLVLVRWIVGINQCSFS